MKSNALPSRFRRRPIIIAVCGIVAYVLLVAAFAIPNALMSSNDEADVDEASEERAAEFAEAQERYEELQLELAIAQCEADRETITAGALVNRLEQVLELTAAFGPDTSLITGAEKPPLVEAIETAEQGLAALEVTSEQRALVEEFGDEIPDCDSQAPQPAPVDIEGTPTAEDLEELQESIEAIESDLAAVAPEGVRVEEVATVIEPLAEPALLAAETRTMPAYYQGFLANGSAESMEAFVEASGDLDEAVERYAEDASLDETLSVLARLAELADWSNIVIQEHNGAQQQPSPTTQPPAPPTNDPPPEEEDDDDEEIIEEPVDPSPPEDPEPSD